MNVIIPLLLLAGTSQGLANTIRKYSSTTQHRATSMTTATMLVNTIISSPLLFYEFKTSNSWYIWILTFISAIIFAISTAFFFKSYQHLELSIATLLQRSSILFIPIIGVVFLQEQISLFGIFGLLCLFIASVSVTFENKKFIISKGIWYALLSALFGSIAAVLDKKILYDFSPYTYAVVNNFLVGITFLWRKNTIYESLSFFPKLSFPYSNIIFFGMSGFLVLLVALSQNQVSQVTPIYKTVSIIVPVLLGIVYFKETKNITQKLFGLIFACLGILLLYL